MNAKDLVSKTNRGLLDPDSSSDEENEAAVELIQFIINEAGKNWTEEQREEGCALLFENFRNGKLELVSMKEKILVVNKEEGKIFVTIG